MTTVYDASNWPDLQNDPRKPALIGWLKANAINPDDVPPEQRIVVNEDLIWYVAFARDETGAKVRVNHGPLLEACTAICRAQPPAELVGEAP